MNSDLGIIHRSKFVYLYKQFKKYKQLALVEQMNEEHSEGITLLVQYLEKEIVVGKLKSIDCIGVDLLGIERDSQVYELHHPFPKQLNSTEEVKQYLLRMIEVIM